MMSTPFVDNSRVFKLFCAAIFVSTELLTQQLWALNREQGFLDIFNMLSWSNNFIWSYKTPVNLATVGDEIPQHLIYMLQQAIQYGGTQQLEFLPEATRTKVRMVLNSLKEDNNSNTLV